MLQNPNEITNSVRLTLHYCPYIPYTSSIGFETFRREFLKFIDDQTFESFKSLGRKRSLKYCFTHFRKTQATVQCYKEVFGLLVWRLFIKD